MPSSSNLLHTTPNQPGNGKPCQATISPVPQERRRLGNEGELLDLDARPRPGRLSSSASITTSETSSRSTSRASSIRRQVMRFRTDTGCIEFLSLKDKTISSVDNTLFNTMKQFGRCQQFILDTLKQFYIEKLENNSTVLIQW